MPRSWKRVAGARRLSAPIRCRRCTTSCPASGASDSPDPDLDYDLIVVGDCGELERTGRVLTDHAELFGRVPS
jgi:hypothetical protein